MINATSVETMAEEVNDEVLSSDDERTYGGLGKVKEGAFEIEDDEWRIIIINYYTNQMSLKSSSEKLSNELLVYFQKLKSLYCSYT